MQGSSSCCQLVALSTGKKVISLNPNSYKAVAGTGTASVESFSVDFADSDFDYVITGVEDEAGGGAAAARR